MPFAEINTHTKIYYELSGHGSPIVFIAGYRCDHAVWDSIRTALAPEFKVLVFDNLGVGQTSDSGAPLSLEDMAKATVDLCDQLELKKPHIIGQSMGSSIAQIIATQYPQKIGKLILINSTTHLSTRTRLALTSLTKLGLENIAFNALFEVGLPWFYSSSYLEQTSQIEEQKSKILHAPYPQSIDNQFRQLNTLLPFDSRQWAHNIKQKTLVIASEEDIITTPNEGLTLAKLIKGAQFLIIPGAHGSLSESNEYLSQAIINFLSSSIECE